MGKDQNLRYILWRGENLSYKINEDNKNSNVQVMGFENYNFPEKNVQPVPIKLQKKCRSFLRGNSESREEGVSPLVNITFHS